MASSPSSSAECRICYEAFDGRARRPERLACCRHRVCAACLGRLAGGSGLAALRCPFCRREAPLPEAGRARALLGGRRADELLLLCPPGPGPGASSGPSSDCLVLTLLEVPAGLAAPGGAGGLLLELEGLRRPPRWPSAPGCLLAGLGLLYFSSLPLGVYLLLLGRRGPGLALLGLVPAALPLGLLYSLARGLLLRRRRPRPSCRDDAPA